MRILIEMNENLYTRLFDNGVEFNTDDQYELEQAVRHGKVLPKGHGKLITEPTEEEIAEMIGGQNDFADCIREAVKTVFANAQTIIEADTESEGKE